MTLWLVSVLAAQTRAAGRVVRVNAGDTLPVGGAPVVLHRVGRATQGPIDTVRADARGRFSLRFLPDTGSSYLLSVRHHGIEYFSSPMATEPARADTAVVLVIADTSSAAAVAAHERTLLVSRPDAEGTRAVVDWFVLLNAGERTRVAPDSVRPTWGAPLPAAAQAVGLADPRLSQFSPDAVSFRHDSVLVFAPLPPGRKELVLQYQIPATLRSFRVPPAPGTDSVFVMLEEPSARVVAPRMQVIDSQRLDGRPFRRWGGTPGEAASFEIQFPAAPLSPRVILLLLVGAAGLSFAVLAALALRRRALAANPDPVWLADAIARLDASQLKRGSAASPEEEERYRTARARLKDALARALAAPPQRS